MPTEKYYQIGLTISRLCDSILNDSLPSLIMNEPTKSKFLNWEAASRDTIDVKRIYIDMAEDLVSGIMLSQIVYWHLPNKRGESKMKVTRDNELWIAKSFSEWIHECRLSKKQARRAIEHLEELGLVVTAVYHFAGKPCTHIRIEWDTFFDKFSFIVNNVNTPQSVEEYWDKVNEKDGRSVTRSTTKEVNDQKGNLPLSNFTPVVKYQKGTLQSTLKDVCYTESTTETTSSQTFFAEEPQQALVKPIQLPITDLKTLDSKESVLQALGRLVPFAIDSDTQLRTLTTKDITNFKRDCKKHKTACTCLHTYEIIPYKLLNEITNILASGAVDWAREGKHATKLVRSLITLKYTMEDILYCMAWAYQTEQFKFYAISSTSVSKLMPKFLDLKRTDQLKDSLSLKPRESTHDRNWRELQKNKEEIINNAARDTKEFAIKHGITARPKL